MCIRDSRIGAPGSALLADGLERNTDLMAITLDDNPLTMQGIRELLRTASEAVPRTFSLKKCCFARNPKIQYDPAEPAGSYSMDLNDPYSQRVLKNLVRYQADGSGAFDKSSPCVIRASPSDIDDDGGWLSVKELGDGLRSVGIYMNCLLYTSPSPRDKRQSRMPSSA